MGVENFHEGWYSDFVWENIFMFIFQYLIFSIVFVISALVILRWKILGLMLYFIIGAFCFMFFSGANFKVLKEPLYAFVSKVLFICNLHFPHELECLQ